MTATIPSRVLTKHRQRWVQILLYKAFADLRVDAQRFYIGYLWWVVEPLLEMLVCYVVFAHLLRRSTEDYVAFLLCGLIPWRWFSATLSRGAGSIVNNHALASQVFVPKIVFPLVVVAADAAKFVITLALLVLFLHLYGIPAGVAYLAIPLIFLVEILLIAALTVLAAAVVPFLPSLTVVINTGLRVAFFMTGIFFPVRSIPEAWLPWLYLNPMVAVVESWRSVLMYGRGPDWPALVVIAVVALAGLWAGRALIRRHEFTYPKLTR